jgi:hypothetical protein
MYVRALQDALDAAQAELDKNPVVAKERHRLHNAEDRVSDLESLVHDLTIILRKFCYFAKGDNSKAELVNCALGLIGLVKKGERNEIGTFGSGASHPGGK